MALPATHLEPENDVHKKTIFPTDRNADYPESSSISPPRAPSPNSLGMCSQNCVSASCAPGSSPE